jgi:hypothetical protein
MANPWVLLIAATIALAVLIVKNWTKIKTTVSNVLSSIKSFFAGVWDWIVDKAQWAAGQVLATIDSMLGPLDEIIGKVAQVGSFQHRVMFRPSNAERPPIRRAEPVGSFPLLAGAIPIAGRGLAADWPQTVSESVASAEAHKQISF